MFLRDSFRKFVEKDFWIIGCNYRDDLHISRNIYNLLDEIREIGKCLR